MQTDPIGYKDDLDLYAYVGDDPVNKGDPSGGRDCEITVGCTVVYSESTLGQSNGRSQQNAANEGMPVTLPNGSHVHDSNSPTGSMMSPAANLNDVAEAGRQAGAIFNNMLKSDPQLAALFEMTSFGLSVGTGGKFDYQRSGNQFLGILHFIPFGHHPQFRDVSNFNVGLYSQKFGLSLSETLNLTGRYAHMFSSNAAPNQPYGLDPRVKQFVIEGYNSGAMYAPP